MLDFEKIESYKENNRIEAKRALGGLPHSIWETYSAFANTLGGFILLGVEENKDHTLRTIDLPCPEMLTEEFRRILNDKHKVSTNILSENCVQIKEVDGNSIIVIYVPRARWYERPVYLDGNVKNSYKRNGEGDYRCTDEEIAAMQYVSTLEPEQIYRTAGRRFSPKAIDQRRAVIYYLTENACAPAAQIADLLDLSLTRTREILRSMIADGIVSAKGNGKARVYKLKS